MLKILMQNPAVQAVLAICTITGTIFGIWGFAISRRRKEISYAVESFVLVKKNKSTIPKMKLLFDNRQVESLTATNITLWNSGNDAIQRGDIVKDKPLILSAPDTVEILDVQVMKQNEESNLFSVEMVDGTPTIDFDYMNKKEGAVLQVYHTGPADELALDCKIIGGKPPRQLRLSKAEIDPVLIMMACNAAVLALALVIVAAGAATSTAVVAGVVAGAAVAVADAVAGAAALVLVIVAGAGAVTVAIAGAFGAFGVVVADVVANIADLSPYFAVSFACTLLMLSIFLRTQNISFSRIPKSLQ